MTRRAVWITLVVLLVSYAIPTLAAPAAAPLYQGEPLTGSFGDPNDLYLSYTISGADFSQDPDGAPHFQGRYTGTPIHFSGTMIVSRPESLISTVSMRARLGDQSVSWPKEGEDNTVQGRTVKVPFDFTFQVPPDYDSQWITGSAFVQACGGVCGSYAVEITIELPPATPTPTPLPEPKSPCPEPMLFFPGMDLQGYFTGHPPLRFSGEQMRADLVGALQRYIAEDNEVEMGVGLTDVHTLAKAFISTALPTGNEAALQEAARRLAQEKQQTDPNYRLTPGDLFYLSLRQNKGNVRDALVTCHAALYRDGAGVNKKFVEQENVLTPLRNPEGYTDAEWSYRTPRGSERVVNPRAELAADEQGVWYHFFGLAALEFTDSYGAASHVAAWLAIWGGALPSNYTDQVIERGVPVSNLGGGLGDLAIGLEHNVRSNMGKPPDVAKYCINYYALGAGSGLKDVMAVQLELERQRHSSSFAPMDSAGDFVTPEGVVIYKSPLSILVQGTGGEWFSFDQRDGMIDGNTPLMYFELYPEEDGTLGFLGVPFFEVASLQMTGVGEGPVTLGVYDRDSEESDVFQFEVQSGDEIRVEGLSGTPSLNGVSLAESGEASVGDSGGFISDNVWLIGLIAGGGLLALAAGGLLVLLLLRSRGPAARPAPIRGSVVSPPAASGPVAPTTGAASGQWQLIAEDGPHAGQRFPLGSQARLGRDVDNDLRINDAQVSRHHALLQRQGQDYVISDLSSSNGTYVNGSRVTRPVRLRPGDVIQVGQTRFRFGPVK